jgi:hypothetical protein
MGLFDVVEELEELVDEAVVEVLVHTCQNKSKGARCNNIRGLGCGIRWKTLASSLGTRYIV